MNEKLSSDGGDYEQRGITELEDDGKMRKVRVVLEKKTGKELLQDVTDGTYTVPKWSARSDRIGEMMLILCPGTTPCLA